MQKLKLITHDETDLYHAVQLQGSEKQEDVLLWTRGHVEELYINQPIFPLLPFLFFVLLITKSHRALQPRDRDSRQSLIVIRFQCAHNRLQHKFGDPEKTQHIQILSPS